MEMVGLGRARDLLADDVLEPNTKELGNVVVLDRLRIQLMPAAPRLRVYARPEHSDSTLGVEGRLR